MGINKIEELNQKRFQKRQEAEIFLKNLNNITTNSRFNFNMEGVIFELKGLIDKFSRDSVKISLLSEISSGKSTFLNALVFDKPILESKIGETTTKLFHIKYGERYTIDGIEKENIDELKAEIAQLNQTIERLQSAEPKKIVSKYDKDNALSALKRDLSEGRRKHVYNNLLLNQ